MFIHIQMYYYLMLCLCTLQQITSRQLNEKLKSVFEAFQDRSTYLNCIKDPTPRPPSGSMQGPPALGTASVSVYTQHWLDRQHQLNFIHLVLNKLKQNVKNEKDQFEWHRLSIHVNAVMLVLEMYCFSLIQKYFQDN